jgi:hypothetical protein
MKVGRCLSWMSAGVLLLGVAAGAAPAAKPVAETSRSDPAARPLIDATKAYLKDKQARRYDRAYAMIASSMRSYLTAELFRDTAERFLTDAGKPGDVQLTGFTWYRDPPDAPEPGLYAAVDFTAHFANLELMCGYLMWHQVADGQFRIVREEQNFIDRQAAGQMVPEQRDKLPRLFGCVSR